MMERDPHLNYATPEEKGISSANITDFLLQLGERELNMNGFVLMRDGAVISEGYWKPYTPERTHRIYSMTKSFTALAIGLLQDEGKLSIHDPLMKYFPEYLTEDLDPYMKEATIRDLMMMASPQSYTTYSYDRDDNWSETFFRTRPSHPAGTIFSYDTSASDVLAALVDRLSGTSMLEYMKSRMFDEMGFSPETAIINNPEGYTSGGSGMLCTPRDLAKVGQMLLDGGRWNGKQLLSEAYVREATSCRIPNQVFGWLDDPTSGYGYGYFIWRLWNNSYAFLGMGDQMVVVIPDKRIVFVAVEDNQHSPDATVLLIRNLWKYVADPATDGPLPPNPREREILDKYVAQLTLVTPDGDDSSPLEDQWNGATWMLDEPNRMGWKSFALSWKDGEGTLDYDTVRGRKTLRFGLGHYAMTELMEPQYSGRTFKHPVNRNYVTAACGTWVMDRQLLIKAYVQDDHIGNFTMHFSFTEDGRVSLFFVSQAEWFLREYDGFGKGHRMN